MSRKLEYLQTITYAASFILSKVDERESTFTKDLYDIDYPEVLSMARYDARQLDQIADNVTAVY